MSDKKYMLLITDMMIFVIGTVMTKVIQFLLMPLYTTYMSTEAYGIAELTNNMSELFFPIITLCIYEATFRFVIESKFSKEEILTASIKILFISFLISFIVLIIINSFFSYKYVLYFYFILYSYSLKMLLLYYVRAKGYSKLVASSGIIEAIFLAIFNVVFLLFLKLAVTGYLLAIGFAYLLSVIYLFTRGQAYKEINLNLQTNIITKELLAYSVPLIMYNVGYWLSLMSGRYILLWKTDASIAGTYAAVIKIAAVINMLQQAFYAAFQLNTSRAYEDDRKEEYYSIIFNLYSSIVLCLGSIIICFAPLLATFTLKNQFYSARVYLPLILFTAILDCIFCFYKTMYTTYKLTRRAVPSMIIGAIVNIFVCLVTVTKFGIWGICAANFLCYIYQAIYRVFDVKKFINLNCNWKIILVNIFIMCIQVILLSLNEVIYIKISWSLAALIFIINIIVYNKAYYNMAFAIYRRFK